MERSFYTRWVLLDRERDRRSAPKAVDERQAPGDGSLVCARCGHHISDEASRIAMDGAHEHTFVNPAGYSFHIGCFSSAPGCAHHGTVETAFSWFPGWSWQLAACARCGAHLGWHYRAELAGVTATSQSAPFHGLILVALRGH